LLPRSGFSLHRVSTSSTNILPLLNSVFKIFCCTQTHTWLFRSQYLFSLREYILGRNCEDPLSLKPLLLCVIAVLIIEVYLREEP